MFYIILEKTEHLTLILKLNVRISYPRCELVIETFACYQLFVSTSTPSDKFDTWESTFYENLLLVCSKPYPPKLLLQLENDNFKYLGYVPMWGMPWPRLRAHAGMPRP